LLRKVTRLVENQGRHHILKRKLVSLQAWKALVVNLSLMHLKICRRT